MCEIITLNKTDNELLDRVEVLFRDFYDGMSEQGLRIPLPAGGEKLWRQWVEGSLGRSNQLLVVKVDGEAVGFAWGTLRMMPEYLGAGLVGFVSALYIVPGQRRSGYGEKLYAALEEWFRSRRVATMELQVLTGNASGIEFWGSLGYGQELLQMRKNPDNQD